MINGSSTTDLGDVNEGFPTTQWTALRTYKHTSRAQKQAIIASLADKYWRPVYSWLRIKGYPIEKSKDLTQGFFCEIILNRELIQRVDQTKGRFRTYLLKALKAYVSDEFRREHAQKRMPRGKLISFDAAEMLPTCAQSASPDEVFNFTWASNLLNDVIQGLKEEYLRNKRSTHWEIFREKILNPILEDQPGPSYEKLCKKYHVPDAQQAAAMTTTVKRRFRSFLRETVKPYVKSDPEVDDEIAELLAFFSKRDA